MPFNTVRLETDFSGVGSAMVVLLLRDCPTKSDRIAQIVRIGLVDVKRQGYDSSTNVGMR
jgi:hypothetical protein